LSLDEIPCSSALFFHVYFTEPFTAALAAFYAKIPVGHVEAGLRTFNKYSPFPEEMNRCLTSRIAEFHFVPTENNKKNLVDENITQNIYVTGTRSSILSRIPSELIMFFMINSFSKLTFQKADIFC
jgi:arginyl-tRNA--protein-N-Asp/Glu arginylyltransferase